MNADAEYHGWIVFDLSRGLHVRDLVDPDLARPMAVCRVGASLSEIVKILVECPGARNVYVIDERGRLQGQVSLSTISEILLLEYQPSRVYPRLIRAITARTAEDVMEPVEVEIDLSSSKTYCPVAKDLLREVRSRARQQGVSTETLVNLWLQERICAS